MNSLKLKLGAALIAALASTPFCLAQAPAMAPAAPAAVANPAQGPIVAALRTQWQGVRDKVVNIADIVPEDKLGFQATPDVRTFKALIAHIASEGYSILAPLGTVPGATTYTEAQLSALTTKAELMKALRDSYDYQSKLIDGLTEASASEMVAGRGRGGAMVPRWNAIVSLIVDNMDHYGNLVTYVRLIGLVPPTTAARGAGRGGAAAGGAGRGGPGGAAPQGAPAAPMAPAK